MNLDVWNEDWGAIVDVQRLGIRVNSNKKSEICGKQGDIFPKLVEINVNKGVEFNFFYIIFSIPNQ